MSKKFGKILIGGAAVAAAAAAGFAYFVKKKEKECSWNENMEDFEDGFDEEDSDEEAGSPADANVSREYVTLHVDHKAEEAAPEEDDDDFEEEEPLDDDDEPADTKVRDAVASGVETAVQHASEDTEEE
ncbi:MAG: hypothetical protein Q4F41_18050 [Eubacteriales bacterium]|nr:hypothetical protein [Eubacteriales bacterium]